jgi:hypothetical protein
MTVVHAERGEYNIGIYRPAVTMRRALILPSGETTCQREFTSIVFIENLETLLLNTQGKGYTALTFLEL